MEKGVNLFVSMSVVFILLSVINMSKTNFKTCMIFKII